MKISILTQSKLPSILCKQLKYEKSEEMITKNFKILIAITVNRKQTVTG